MKTIRINKGEYWYGLCANHGTQFPLHAGAEYQCSFTAEYSGNQEAPLLCSSDGRYVWSDAPYDIAVRDGAITLTPGKAEIVLNEAGRTLKEAFRNAAAAHFPGNGKLPPRSFFVKPQYNSWVELIYDQNQRDLLQYAHGILDHGLPPGILAAPVTAKGARTRKVMLPRIAGKWRYCDGSLHDGGREVEVPAPLDRLPYFIKTD